MCRPGLEGTQRARTGGHVVISKRFRLVAVVKSPTWLQSAMRLLTEFLIYVVCGLDLLRLLFGCCVSFISNGELIWLFSLGNVPFQRSLSIRQQGVWAMCIKCVSQFSCVLKWRVLHSSATAWLFKGFDSQEARVKSQRPTAISQMPASSSTN